MMEAGHEVYGDERTAGIALPPKCHGGSDVSAVLPETHFGTWRISGASLAACLAESRCAGETRGSSTPRGIRMRSYRMVDFGAPLEAVDVGTPEPTGTQVLLRVRAAGVCHSDLHIWDGGYDLGFGRRMALKDRGIQVPLTLGHETTGEVVAVGPEARGAVRPGEMRLIYPWIGCGSCAVCVRGDENLCAKPRFLGVYCDGGYSDHITVPHPNT